MIWDTYPASYRSREIESILQAVRTGQSVALIGLSGAGKSNLIGFLAQRAGPQRLPSHRFALVDFNRLSDPSLLAIFALMAGSLTGSRPGSISDALHALEETAAAALVGSQGLCFLLDRFDALPPDMLARLSSSLRALRDDFKYRLCYVIATRRPLDPTSELAELFYAHTMWLGPLSLEDAQWSARRDLERFGLPADEETVRRLVELSWGYPSFLRAAVEACADGAVLEETILLAHPAVQRRVEEFWSDQPSPDDLTRARLSGHPFLSLAPRQTHSSADLTAKEQRLWVYFQEHAGLVCSKDELIRAVWPEDKLFLEGIRDDSLAQLIRRLRKKVETNPEQPLLIHTVPGRGYILKI